MELPSALPAGCNNTRCLRTAIHGRGCCSSSSDRPAAVASSLELVGHIGPLCSSRHCPVAAVPGGAAARRGAMWVLAETHADQWLRAYKTPLTVLAFPRPWEG